MHARTADCVPSARMSARAASSRSAGAEASEHQVQAELLHRALLDHLAETSSTVNDSARQFLLCQMYCDAVQVQATRKRKDLSAEQQVRGEPVSWRPAIFSHFDNAAAKKYDDAGVIEECTLSSADKSCLLDTTSIAHLDLVAMMEYSTCRL